MSCMELFFYPCSSMYGESSNHTLTGIFFLLHMETFCILTRNTRARTHAEKLILNKKRVYVKRCIFKELSIVKIPLV